MKTKSEEMANEASKMLILTGEKEQAKNNFEKNTVTIEGIVASTPYKKQFDNGNKMVLFTLSHYNDFRTKAGEQVRVTEWFQVISWNRIAEKIINNTCKGSRVKLKGHLRSSFWKDQTGASHRSVQIVATEFLAQVA